MRWTKLAKFKSRKAILAAVVAIGGSALLFQGFTQAATIVQLKKVNTTPTSYESITAGLTLAGQVSSPEGYKTTYYVVKAIDQGDSSQTPSSKDITNKAAAEIGAKALWEIYGISLDGQVIEMEYDKGNTSLPRATWHANVRIDGKLAYTFTVDSVTGDLFDISYVRELDQEVSVAVDKALDKNPQEYEELGKKIAEKFDVVHGVVKSVAYNGQGYSNNDPTIAVKITGENGEIALMDFSRYDQKLIGISYHAKLQYFHENNEKKTSKESVKQSGKETSKAPVKEKAKETTKETDKKKIEQPSKQVADNKSSSTVTADTAPPLVIDGVQVNALQQEYHMTMGGVVQQIIDNATNEAINKAFVDNKGSDVNAPASYSWTANMDVPGSYYKNGQYDFLDSKGTSVKRYEIYSLLRAFPDDQLAQYPDVLLHDASEDKWYLFSEPAKNKINQLIDTASSNGSVKVISNTAV
ncbi:hypothetical protein [Paenibacillus glycanilyticus]|uniref:hypothetical protein n=1 Tax=Paenibacillus glycanilyticus TaxID=126569 RepID=UPI000FDC4BF7|nr:hypothetical protein [Paenibacillus glycanilyticus]